MGLAECQQVHIVVVNVKTPRNFIVTIVTTCCVDVNTKARIAVVLTAISANSARNASREPVLLTLWWATSGEIIRNPCDGYVLPRAIVLGVEN